MSESDSSLLRAIRHYQGCLDKYTEYRNDAKLLQYLDKLCKLPIKVVHLEDTGVGRTVNGLRKLGGDVGDSAKSLVARWKDMVVGEQDDEDEDDDDDDEEDEGVESGSPSEPSLSDFEDLHEKVPNDNTSHNKSDTSASPNQSHKESPKPSKPTHSTSKSSDSSHNHTDSKHSTKKHKSHHKSNGHSSSSSSSSKHKSHKRKNDDSESEEDVKYQKRPKKTESSDDEHVKPKTRKLDSDSEDEPPKIKEKKNRHRPESDEERKKNKAKKHRDSSSDEPEDREVPKASSSKPKDKHKEPSDKREKDKERHSKTEKLKKDDSKKHGDSKRTKEHESSSSSSSKKDKERKSSSTKGKDSQKEKSDEKKKSSKSKTSTNSNGSVTIAGIDSGSGASFGEALGMLCAPSSSKSKSKKPREAERREEKKEKIASKSDDSVPKLLKEPVVEPIDLNISSLLPPITPNYRPLGNSFINDAQPKKYISDYEALSNIIWAKNQRTKVYSGNKITGGKVPSLFESCIRVLQDNIDALEYTGGVPYLVLKPILEKSTPNQLFVLEHHNPYLIEDTDELWQLHCQKDFRNKKREELESWREMYMRCLDERDAKLKALTANIKQSQDKSLPVRTTKMAYVDDHVKPPRNIARKQAKNGTGFDKRPALTPSARLSTIASAGDSSKVAVPNPGARAMERASNHAHVKPKKAPLMMKSLSLMKNRFRR